MPLAGGAAGPDEQAFASALTDDITSVLSRISLLLVTGSYTAEALAERDAGIAEVAEAFGERYVRRGSVQRSRVRTDAGARRYRIRRGKCIGE